MSEYFKNKVNWCNKMCAEYLNENSECWLHYTGECKSRSAWISVKVKIIITNSLVGI